MPKLFALMKGLLVSAVCTIVASCAATPAQSVYRIVPQKPADAVTVLTREGRTTFVVSSETGIGSADIELAGVAWPKIVVIRFTYTDGRGFKMLEGRTTSNGALTLRDEGLPAGYRNGAMEMVVPAKLLIGSKRLKLSWIDAYRE
jgi:hypothetical protein